MKVLRMADQDLAGKRVLIREDLNVPVEGGKVTSDARIRASLPTIQLALDKGAKVFLTSHLGRPEEGVYAEEFSLAPVAARLSELLGKQVPLKKDWLGGVDCAGRARRCCSRTCASTRARRRTRKISRSRWRRCATSSSWTRSAPRIAPRRRRTASASSRRSPARARCWSASSRRSSARWRSRRGRWSPSSRAPRSRPSSRCSSRCSPRSTS